MAPGDVEEDLFVEVPETGEVEQELQTLKPSELGQAVVNATDWTCETIISQINKGNIQLNPSFQRRDAWRIDRKSRFIESLLLGLPVPQLVLAESGKRGAYIVIDGKQRLLSIRQFAASTDDKVFSQLKLKNLMLRPELNGMTLESLRSDIARTDDLRAFENTPIRTVVIKNWPSESFLYHVFLRLNTGSLPLSPQELRQALHPGPFVTYADEAAGNSAALRKILGRAQPDFRMRDVELFVRYIAFQTHLSKYVGDLKAFLDLTCKELNGKWATEEQPVRDLTQQFEYGYEIARDIFGEKSVFRKWTSDGYEPRFNRAVFDAVMFYFANPEIRAVAKARPVDAKRAFEDLCSRNQAFLAAIERTTKSLDATATRLSLWGEALSRAIGHPIRTPRIVDNRIEWK